MCGAEGQGCSAVSCSVSRSPSRRRSTLHSCPQGFMAPLRPEPHLPERVVWTDGCRHLLLGRAVPLSRHLPQPHDVPACTQHGGGRSGARRDGREGSRDAGQQLQYDEAWQHARVRRGRRRGSYGRSHPELRRDTSCTRSLRGMFRMAPLRAGQRPVGGAGETWRLRFVKPCPCSQQMRSWDCDHRCRHCLLLPLL